MRRALSRLWAAGCGPLACAPCTGLLATGCSWHELSSNGTTSSSGSSNGITSTSGRFMSSTAAGTPAFVLDIDGVLVRGKEVLEPARRAMGKVRVRAMPPAPCVKCAAGPPAPCEVRTGRAPKRLPPIACAAAPWWRLDITLRLHDKRWRVLGVYKGAAAGGMAGRARARGPGAYTHPQRTSPDMHGCLRTHGTHSRSSPTRAHVRHRSSSATPRCGSLCLG